jgi:hypothetical protein
MLFYAESVMMQTEQSKAIDKGMRTLWFIWAAMLGSLFMYIFIYHLLGEGFRNSGASVLPISLLRRTCALLAVGALLTGYYIRRFTPKRQTEAAKQAMVRRAATLNQPPFMTHYTALVTVSLACAESVGIYGFVLFLLGDGFQTLYTFIGVSALAMIFYRPKREELEKLAMAYNKQSGAMPQI